MIRRYCGLKASGLWLPGHIPKVDQVRIVRERSGSLQHGALKEMAPQEIPGGGRGSRYLFISVAIWRWCSSAGRVFAAQAFSSAFSPSSP